MYERTKCWREVGQVEKCWQSTDVVHCRPIVGEVEKCWQSTDVQDGRPIIYSILLYSRVEGGGRASSSPARADFSIMMECTPQIGHCHSICTLWEEPPSVQEVDQLWERKEPCGQSTGE
jgi:hypothetical protein